MFTKIARYDMIAKYHKVPLSPFESFSVRTDIAKNFYNQWHYHPEAELIYIVKGEGVAFLGNSITNISEGELLLLSPNLPHMMKSQPQETLFHVSSAEDFTEAVVIHFEKKIFDSLIDLPENKNIQLFFNNLQGGFRINGKTNDEICVLLQTLRYTSGSRRFIALLEIVQTLAESSNVVQICTPSPSVYNSLDENRLNRIFHFTLSNFTKEIKLKDIANVIHMTPHSFCRYFRSRTKKRYSLFLMELRISHACKLLITTHYSVAVVSYESGFMNFSNFNRHFKEITGKTPVAYRKQFEKHGERK